MRVLHIAPLWLPVSDDASGGIETFLAGLVSEQRRLGTDVAIVASGDSRTTARLVAPIETNLVDLMQEGVASEHEYYEQAAVRAIVDHHADFDVIHNHAGPTFLALDALLPATAVLHTIHAQITSDLAWFLRRHPTTRVTTVSQAQADALRRLEVSVWQTIPNGIALPEGIDDGPAWGGLAFVGRIEAAKGADLAVMVAQQTGRPLRLAGPIRDREFFERCIQPALLGNIEYVGVLGRRDKFALLASACCSLVPSRWAEPFGLVAVEAMSCGTPVAALASGALPELVESGVTGYAVDDPDELVDAVERAIALDRSTVRERARARFSMATVAQAYASAYARLLTEGRC